MVYLNEADIIKIIAEKCKVEPEDVTLKLDITASRVMAIVEEKPKEDDGMVFIIKKDQINPETWAALMKATNEGKTIHIFEE